MTVTLSEITVYPIKSCTGKDLADSYVGDFGLLHDRSYMIIQPDGNMITQRTHPMLSQITVSFTDELLFQAAKLPDFKLPLGNPGRVRKAVIWEVECQGFDCGDGIAAWLEQAVGEKLRLVHFDPSCKRPVPFHEGMLKSVTAFSDGYPILLISEASLADLNRRMQVPLPMTRFRPNLVVSGCDPYAEDTWKQIRIGEVVCDLVKPCERCVFTTVDQKTGKSGAEPLKTLAKYRRQGAAVIFGMNLVHRNKGTLRVGDTVEVLA